MAAVDESKPSFDEGNDGIAQGRGLPWIGLDARFAIDRDGNLAIAGAVHATVGGAELQPEATPLLGGHPRIARNGTAMQRTSEARQRVDSIKDIGVDWDDGGERIVWRGAGKEEDLEIVMRKEAVGAFGTVTRDGERVCEQIRG